VELFFLTQPISNFDTKLGRNIYINITIEFTLNDHYIKAYIVINKNDIKIVKDTSKIYKAYDVIIYIYIL
jgi:hypothetical protein